MTEEVQPVEEVEIEEVAQPEQTLDIETAETETDEETPAPSAEIDEEAKQKEEARKHFTERQSRREREEKLERENEYLRQQLMGGNNQAQQSQQPTQQAGDPNEPDLDAFLENGYTAQQFFKAHKAWEKDTDEKASAENEVISSYSSQMAEFAKKVPDVYNYAKAADRLVSPAVQDAILRSTKAPEIIEKIALNENFARELNSSRDLHDLSRKIARFELDQPKVKAPVSSAPRGPSTPKSQPTISAQTDLSTLTHAEYAAFRRSQRNN